MSKQTMLVAIGVHGRGCLMGYRGGDVIEFWKDPSYSRHAKVFDLYDLFSILELPSKPGLYVWDGEFYWTPYENGHECYPEHDGQFRPATPEDIADLMGTMDPPPEPDPDADRDSPGT